MKSGSTTPWRLRRRILIAFEAAEREHDPGCARSRRTFVLVRGGPTGVEFAGALGEMARDTLRRDFRVDRHGRDAIMLVEAMDRILPRYPKIAPRRLAASSSAR